MIVQDVLVLGSASDQEKPDVEQDDTIDSRVSGSAATPVTERPEGADASALASLLRSEVSDTPDRQRERRFACPFCGKYVRNQG